MLKNLRNRLNETKGFSLVELIVVIAIMVILIAMLVPNVVGYINKATLSTEKQAASTLFSAAQTYATDAYSKYRDFDAGTITVEMLAEEQLISENDAAKFSDAAFTADTNTPSAVAYVTVPSTVQTDPIIYPEGADQA